MNTLQLNRRTLLTATTVFAAGSLPWHHALRAAAPQIAASGKRCILLWMQGGPSQFETFDPKGHTEGKAIATQVAGVRFAESLPQLAGVSDRICLMRSVFSREGSHPRAQYLMHTGYAPMGGGTHPEIGAHVAWGLSSPDSEIPPNIRIQAGGGRGAGGGQGGPGAGPLGVRYEPLVVNDPASPPANTSLPVNEDRFQRRLRLLRANETLAPAAINAPGHLALVETASSLVLSPRLKTFDISDEPSSQREAYGTGKFGEGCLLARRLVEAGTPFVEVVLGNWDTHEDNGNRTSVLCDELDRPAANLILDLDQRGLLDSTLVVWMGEFGRSPKVNGRGGRDHFPRAFSVWMAGCGVRGGQVIGKTSDDGSEIIDRPIAVNDLLRTIYRALGIDANRELHVGTRPLKVADTGTAVDEVF